MKKLMIAKKAMTDAKGVLNEFKKLKSFVRKFLQSKTSCLLITNESVAQSTIIYFLKLRYAGIELVVRSANSSHVTCVNFKNGNVYSTLYSDPIRSMKYLTHFVHNIFSDLILNKAKIKKNEGEKK